MKQLLITCLMFIVLNIFSQGIILPPEFENIPVILNLKDPSAIGFSPDGRLFISERITGDLRVAEYDTVNSTWNLLPTPFYSFDVPTEDHRSSGLRGFTFDPAYGENGYVYAFYMKNNPRHNRVVRIQVDPNNPNIALPPETLLIDLPFNSSTSSGSHNGGDLLFGTDDKLYFTTGDGWNGGDNVQSLETYTGKLFRVNRDGTIPNDNPFYDLATGNFRAIYALGLRNPYTMAIHPESGNFYINDAVLSNKATVYLVNSDGSSMAANYGHDGYNGIGTSTNTWTNTAIGGAKLITGGAWYPDNGYWPEEYKGGYYTAMWGSNNGNAGHIVRVESETVKINSLFASNVLVAPRHKPVMTKIGTDGNLFYLLTDYETGNGQIHMIRFSGQGVATSPVFTPDPGQFDNPIRIAIETSTSESIIYFTTNGDIPNENSTPYSDSILINSSQTVKAITYADSLINSSVAAGSYTIGAVPNLSPIADAGPELIVEINKVATLNGSGSLDPDGSPLEISESWEQIGGPITQLLDEDETVANFTPTVTGTYTFRIAVVDVDGAIDSAEVRITAIHEIPDYLEGLIARWSCEEGFSNKLEDTSPNANRGILDGAYWSMETNDSSDYSLLFDGNDDRIDIGNLDISGQEMSICFWTKLNSFDTHDARFISKAKGQNDSDHLWMVSSLNDDQLRFRLNTDGGGTKNLISSSGVIALNEWIHIAAVYNGSEMKLFKNGFEVVSTSKTGNIGTDPTMDAAIGNQPANATGGARPFDGLMDEIRIYGEALSENEILIVMNAAVEKCNSIVVNNNEMGNGSLRRAIACGVFGDTIAINENVTDTIQINSNPIEVNNFLTLLGNGIIPIIYNTIFEAGIIINPDQTIYLENISFASKYGPLIFNAGEVHLKDVQIITPPSALLPPFQNVGEAQVRGSFEVLKGE